MKRVDALVVLAVLLVLAWLVARLCCAPPAPAPGRNSADLIMQQEWYARPTDPAGLASPLRPGSPISPLYPRS